MKSIINWIKSQSLALLLGEIALVSLSTGFAVWWLASGPSDIVEAPLSGAKIGGPFELTDQDGKRVNSGSFEGRYRLMYFGYTYCPDICPTDVQKMSRALRSFEADAPDRAALVLPIMITIDPERDTPAVMKQFVRAFHPRLIGLTGSPAEIKTVLSAFSIYANRVGPADNTNYLMDHSAIIYLMDPDGKPITFFTREAKEAEIKANLTKYVN